MNESANINMEMAKIVIQMLEFKNEIELLEAKLKQAQKELTKAYSKYKTLVRKSKEIPSKYNQDNNFSCSICISPYRLQIVPHIVPICIL